MGKIIARTNSYVVFSDPFYHPNDSPNTDDHRNILEALRSHDKKKCVSLVKAHLQRAVAGLDKMASGA